MSRPPRYELDPALRSRAIRICLSVLALSSITACTVSTTGGLIAGFLSLLSVGLLVGLTTTTTGCQDDGENVGPCLSIAPDPDVGPCLSQRLDIEEPDVGPCLGAPLDDVVDTDVGPCLSIEPPDVDEPDVGPCLTVDVTPCLSDVGPCLSPPEDILEEPDVVGPCLSPPLEDVVGPCLSPPEDIVEEPEVGPCLSPPAPDVIDEPEVGPCLSPPAPDVTEASNSTPMPMTPPAAAPSRDSRQAARDQVRERLMRAGVLSPELVETLRKGRSRSDEPG